MGCSVSRAHKTWSRSFLFKDFLDHLTVVGIVSWPLTESEAEVDLVLIQTSSPSRTGE